MCYEVALSSKFAPSWAQAVTWCEVGVGLREPKWKEGREPEAGKQKLEPTTAEGCQRGLGFFEQSASPGLSLKLRRWGGKLGEPGRRAGGGGSGLIWTTPAGGEGSHVQAAGPPAAL